jgi:hypothetical protein
MANRLFGNGDEPEWIKRNMHEIRRAQEALAERYAPLIRQARDAHRRLVSPGVERQLREINRALGQLPDMTELHERLREMSEWARAALERELPENWHDFLDRADLPDLLDLTVEHGVAVVWVPRSEIVLELLSANGDVERDQVLVAHEHEILDDVQSVMEDITHPLLADPARATLEAVSTVRDGHHMAAQTLVASAVTHMVNVILGHPSSGKAQRTIRNTDPEDVGLMILRRTMLLHGLANAIERTDDARVGFNRNVTAGHRDLFKHCSPANFLRGLLLLAGLIKDLDVRPLPSSS